MFHSHHWIGSTIRQGWDQSACSTRIPPASALQASALAGRTSAAPVGMTTRTPGRTSTACVGTKTRTPPGLEANDNDSLESGCLDVVCACVYKPGDPTWSPTPLPHKVLGPHLPLHSHCAQRKSCLFQTTRPPQRHCATPQDEPLVHASNWVSRNMPVKHLRKAADIS